MQGTKVYVGVDVGKLYLEVAWGKESRRFGNDGQGHQQLVHWLGGMAGPWQVICEGSGGYERARWCATWRQVE
jgi:hypothetical protein